MPTLLPHIGKHQNSSGRSEVGLTNEGWLLQHHFQSHRSLHMDTLIKHVFLFSSKTKRCRSDLDLVYRIEIGTNTVKRAGCSSIIIKLYGAIILERRAVLGV